ncbi:SLAM family member 7 isoform X1 [Manis javanica]|uniref:SLAM family member 7 isoform X1 n=1 Tax=Manis javanica TaxID=9974 RepID=UPI003C6D671A
MLGPSAHSILIFLLYQLAGPAASGALKELVGALGGSVTFPLKLSANQIDSIVWIFNTTTLVTIQPKMPDKEDIIIITQNHNKKRVEFHRDYSLKLKTLKKSDTGPYRVEIYSSSQGPFSQEYRLQVYEHVSKPQVTMGLQNNENGTCVTNLTCFMEQAGEDVTYSWKSLGQASNESYDGSTLPISWKLGKKDMTFICTARNPISSNYSNPISVWKLCEGPAGVPNVMVWSLLGVFFLLGALVLLPAIWIMRRGKRKESTEEKRMGTQQEIPNYWPPSREISENYTISHANKAISEENPANTLYSTVQIPKKVEKPHSLPSSPDTPRPFAHDHDISPPQG